MKKYIDLGKISLEDPKWMKNLKIHVDNPNIFSYNLFGEGEKYEVFKYVVDKVEMKELTF